MSEGLGDGATFVHIETQELGHLSGDVVRLNNHVALVNLDKAIPRYRFAHNAPGSHVPSPVYAMKSEVILRKFTQPRDNIFYAAPLGK